MKNTYDELLEFDVYRAIEFKAEEQMPYSFKTIEDLQEYNKNNPARTPHHPLLLDYNWVYENAEFLISNNILEYQQYQGVEEYYVLFKAITNKYSIEEDYNNYICGNLKDNYHFKYKWNRFAFMMVEFFSYSFDERLEQLMERNDFISYFLKYPELYNVESLELFGYIGIQKLFNMNILVSYYINNFQELKKLMSRQPKIRIPFSILEDQTFIKQVSRNSNVEEFYCDLNMLSSDSSTYSYLEEHKKYCDEQIQLVEDGILPCLQDEYKEASSIILKMNKQRYFSSLKSQVAYRIFEKNGLPQMPKKFFYQELSKYMIIGFLISRNYETSPYNLMIDIETLYGFAKENNRNLKGMDIYEMLLNFEGMNVFQILEFYKKVKKLPLMDMLYDDWQSQKEIFIEEINSNLLDIDTLEIQTTENGISYYDITEREEAIIVHSTSVSTSDDERQIESLIKDIKEGNTYCLCLSIQDKNNQLFFSDIEMPDIKTIKFLFPKLESNRVGIINHEDAYSQGLNEVESSNSYYKRRLYTFKEFMEKTNQYNEIVYAVNKKTYLPIGIICEETIDESEVKVSEALNIPIFFRKNKKKKKELECSYTLKKRYTNILKDMNLF